LIFGAQLFRLASVDAFEDVTTPRECQITCLKAQGARMKIRKRLAKRLGELKGNKSQAEFSKRVGIGQASLNRLLNCRQNISIDMLDRICSNLKIDVCSLLSKR
jgi:transcriptional regulator with XRE-family HTH domain